MTGNNTQTPNTPEQRPPAQAPKGRGLLRTLQIGIPVVALVAVAAALISDRRHQSAELELPEGCASRTSAEVGGPFSLIDQDGEVFTHENLLGKPALIYFGFTYCPDVCPTALQTMDRALLEAGDVGQSIQPVLISIDPQRDTPATLKQYIGTDAFPDGLIGLTGTAEQVKVAASAYKVGYTRVETPESAAQYLMDHSSIFYLMDSKGKLATFFNDGADPTEIAQCIKALSDKGL